MSTLKVNKIQHIGSSGNGLVVDNKGTVGIATNDLTANSTLLVLQVLWLVYTSVMDHCYSAKI